MSLLAQFQAGGIFMYFILSFLVCTLALIVERSIALYMRIEKNPVDFRKNLLTFTSKGDFLGALGIAKASNAPLAKVAQVGLEIRANGCADEELQARMDEKLSAEIAHIDKRTGFLAMFGNVATLLGLLGTVTGLIGSFAGVAAADPAERAILLGQGISEALNTTAFGLVAAIPALIAFAIFQNRTEKLVTALTDESSEIFHDVLFYTESRDEDMAEFGGRVRNEENITTVRS
ncbi:MAG: MotA/TolQ/ExbB proton channel family protein [Bacteriovoracaceae bacterium]|nr:MotA/TolQ/ExbB proton channel family protein [Bacteriovoracaceae bacterium]